MVCGHHNHPAVSSRSPIPTDRRTSKRPFKVSDGSRKPARRDLVMLDVDVDGIKKWVSQNKGALDSDVFQLDLMAGTKAALHNYDETRQPRRNPPAKNDKALKSSSLPNAFSLRPLRLRLEVSRIPDKPSFTMSSTSRIDQFKKSMSSKKFLAPTATPTRRLASITTSRLTKGKLREHTVTPTKTTTMTKATEVYRKKTLIAQKSTQHVSMYSRTSKPRRTYRTLPSVGSVSTEQTMSVRTTARSSATTSARTTAKRRTSMGATHISASTSKSESRPPKLVERKTNVTRAKLKQTAHKTTTEKPKRGTKNMTKLREGGKELTASTTISASTRRINYPVKYPKATFITIKMTSTASTKRTLPKKRVTTRLPSTWMTFGTKEPDAKRPIKDGRTTDQYFLVSVEHTPTPKSWDSLDTRGVGGAKHQLSKRIMFNKLGATSGAQGFWMDRATKWHSYAVEGILESQTRQWEDMEPAKKRADGLNNTVTLTEEVAMESEIASPDGFDLAPDVQAVVMAPPRANSDTYLIRKEKLQYAKLTSPVPTLYDSSRLLYETDLQLNTSRLCQLVPDVDTNRTTGFFLSPIERR